MSSEWVGGSQNNNCSVGANRCDKRFMCVCASLSMIWCSFASSSTAEGGREKDRESTVSLKKTSRRDMEGSQEASSTLP